jgi:hypothetical protein
MGQLAPYQSLPTQFLNVPGKLRCQSSGEGTCRISFRAATPNGIAPDSDWRLAKDVRKTPSHHIIIQVVTASDE